MQKLGFLFLALAISVFLILSHKNPYATSSLIGNFDPFPDSLHYVVPARNFVASNGFSFARLGGETMIGVPPLYSWSLIPIYFFNTDARTFYFANLILGIVSIILLYKIAYKLSKSIWLTGLLLFLYVTSFVIYWQPSLAMAENILLPVCLGALWLALQPLTNRNIIGSVILAVACYGSKYVTLPVTGVLLLFTLWRIWQANEGKKFLKKACWAMLVAIFTFALLNGNRLFFYLSQFWQSSTANSAQAQQETSWFSFSYISQSLPKYSGALMGMPIYNLWYIKPILPFGLAAIVLLWCLYAVFKIKKRRNLALLILSLVAAQLAFLSMITMIEGRYAFIFIPIILTGAAAMAGWLLEIANKKFGENKTVFWQIIFVGIVASYSLLVSFKDLKTQLLINFKGGETPWWQVGVMAGDQFISQQSPAQAGQAIVISSLSPFVWDFYRQGNYSVMPLSNTQNMVKEKIWGMDFDPNDLLSFYKEQLNLGKTIYLDTVGFGRSDWPVLEDYKAAGFSLNLLREDCVGACKIYEVELNK